MQLIRLEMYGFKSFSNKTEFSFSPGITAFVGPNGCGKSNVVDAIRWVLGEQSPRAIRANRMEDIIFAGSENSAHKNYAEVSIVLDNHDNEIPLDFREVTVTRRYYRSGESEYFLNRVPCRLKDIGEVLASTSLGKGTYAIIGQGQVEEVINSRPEDRRQMFEEAAGTALFKLRKREAMRKLSDTRGHLTRVEDIIHELQGQEDEVKANAAKAKEFLEVKEQSDKIELSLWAGRYHDLHKRLERLEQRKLELETSKNSCQGLLEEKEGDVAIAAAKLEESSEVIAALEQGRAELAGNKTELEYQLQLSSQRQQDYQAMILSANQQMARLKLQLEESDGGIAAVHREIAELEQAIDYFTAALKQRNSSSGLVRRLLAAVEAIKIQTEEKIMQSVLESSDSSSRQDKARHAEAEITAQLDLIQQEINGLETESAELKSNADSLVQANSVTIKTLDSVRQEDIQNKIELAKARDQYRELTTRRNKLEASQHALEQRLEMLQSMELDYQGFSSGARSALKAAREGNLGGIKGAVAELIQVKDSKFSIAVETALGGAMQYIVCESENYCRKAIELLKSSRSGRATFVPLSAATRRTGSRPGHFPQPVLGWADELVNCPVDIESIASMFLGNVLVTENLEIATKLAVEINYRYKIVTLDGDIISKGLFTGGSSGRQSVGLLQRKAQVSELAKQYQEQQVHFEHLSNEVLGADAKCQELSQKHDEIRERLEGYEKEAFMFQAQLEQAQLRFKQAEARISSSRDKSGELASKLDQVRNDISGLGTLINKDKTELEKLQQCKQHLQSKENQLKDLVSVLASRQNSLQLTIFSLQNQLDNRQRQLKSLESQKADLTQRWNTISAEAKNYRDQDGQLLKKLEDTKLALAEIAQGLDSVAASLDGQILVRRGLRDEIEQLNQGINEIREELTQINAALHEADVKKARWQTEEEALVRELQSQFGLEPEAGLAHLDGRYTSGELSSRLKKLQGRLEEMGDVNLAAIGQHQKLMERLGFLTGQREDLAKAEQDILDLVAELDKKIRELFMVTFANVQQHFTDIFKVLFDGGSAYLALSDEDDLLETGIEIFARPPGKKTQSLSLLSGGEKSMTAIALLFALQSVRPSPFCILDEIEAALDDVNIVRFANYLQQLAGGMQFILITHRRETMEHSDSLYGITLAADGSSKPISVALKKSE